MLTVAQMVELQIVVLMVVSSILIRQPNRRIVQLGRTLALGARGHTFKSCYADQMNFMRKEMPSSSAVEHLTVNQNVAGSIPA